MNTNLKGKNRGRERGNRMMGLGRGIKCGKN